MYLTLLIFIIILAIQLVLALNSWLAKHNIAKRYNFILAEGIEAAKTLENYVKIYRKVNLKVDAQINDPAFAMEDFVLINRSKMYLMDLYTNFYLIFQLELSRPTYKFARKLFVIHNLLFFLQFIFLTLGLVLKIEAKNYLLLIAIGLVLFNIILSCLAQRIYKQVLRHAFFIAEDLLNLDDLEKIRAESLKNELKLQPFEYPFDMLYKLIRFILP